MYRNGSSRKWQPAPGGRADWRLTRNWLQKNRVEGKALDVGCLDGGLLAYLGSQLEPYGIEINPEAADTARQRGVDIIGADFGTLKGAVNRFDVVFAMDVIEHVADPGRFLTDLTGAARPGGVIIVSSGNNMAYAWRMMGSRYWYCTNAEHLSFISPNWCRYAAPRSGLAIAYMQRFSHAGNHVGDLCLKLQETGRNLFYLFFPHFFAYLRVRGVGAKDAARSPDLKYFPPAWMTARDHFIVVFRKLL